MREPSNLQRNANHPSTSNSTRLLTTNDRVRHTRKIFSKIIENKFSTPYSDQRSIPSITSKDPLIVALSEDFRNQVQSRMKNIETLVGAKPFECRRGHHARFDFLRKLEQLNSNIFYYKSNKTKLEESYEEFLEYLEGYLETVLAIEVQLIFESDCEASALNYHSSKASFKVIQGELMWTWLEEGYKFSPSSNKKSARGQTAKRGVIIEEMTQSINMRLEKSLAGAIFHIQTSEWLSEPIDDWKTRDICESISTIEDGNKKMLQAPFGGLDTNSELQQFLDIFEKRCERTVMEYEKDRTLGVVKGLLSYKSLRTWLEFQYKEFSHFVSSYTDVLLEDLAAAAITSRAGNRLNKFNSTTPSHQTGERRLKEGVSQKFLKGKKIFKKAPTMGQFWRTKFLKSLSEPESVYLNRMTGLKPKFKRHFRKHMKKHLGNYLDIYMAKEDFNDFKLPERYEKIDTGVPFNVFGGGQANISGVLVTKWVVDLKPQFRAMAIVKRTGPAFKSLVEVTASSRSNGNGERNTTELNDNDEDYDEDVPDPEEEDPNESTIIVRTCRRYAVENDEDNEDNGPNDSDDCMYEDDDWED